MRLISYQNCLSKPITSLVVVLFQHFIVPLLYISLDVLYSDCLRERRNLVHAHHCILPLKINCM